jgi:hypothetical protein
VEEEEKEGGDGKVEKEINIYDDSKKHLTVAYTR